MRDIPGTVNPRQRPARFHVLTEESRWWNVDEVPKRLFDHNEMIDLALKTLRRQLSYQPVGYNLLPDTFTMPQLQQLYETIQGQSLDRRNFQKRMVSYGLLERLEAKKSIGPTKHRIGTDLM